MVLATLGRVVENVIDLAGPSNFTGKPVTDATEAGASPPLTPQFNQTATGAS
jgi:hypothetical protein